MIIVPGALSWSKISFHNCMVYVGFFSLSAYLVKLGGIVGSNKIKFSEEAGRSGTGVEYM